jgi:glycosyltransferase involved in cell wall biosynthesis
VPHCQLSIILPLFNPHIGWEDELKSSLTNLSAYFAHVDYRIVVINDGSTRLSNKKIEDVVRSNAHTVYCHYEKNRGKGYAIRQGVRELSADFYIYTDWDFPFGQKIIFEIYQQLVKGNIDLMIGKRNATYFKSLPWERRIVSESLKLVNYIVTGFKIGDTQAGLKGLSPRASEILLATQTDTFVFEFEFIRASLKQRINYSFIEISIDESVRFSNFSIKTFYKEFRNYIKLFF